MRFFVTIVVVAALGAGGYFGYRAWFQPEEQIRYKTASVERRTVVQTVTATGTVEPLVTVLVGSQVSGTVVKYYADFNQEVKEGDLLAELDPDRFLATVEQRTAAVVVAKARVEEAAARVAEARLERQRIESAFQRSVASNFEMESVKIGEDVAVAALHAAEGQVVSAQAELRASQIEHDKTIIRSPIAGVVISRDVDAGQTVAASLSAPTLFTIANDLRKMRINAAVSETDIGQIREGMDADFRVDAYPERRFRGVVTQVRFAETVIDNIVTYETLIDVENPDLALRPGMTATIQFEVKKAEDVLVVPNAALRFDPNLEPVVVNRRPGRGRARMPRVYKLVGGALVEVEIELGINDGSFTQVTTDELKEDDPVVTEQILPGQGFSPQRMMRRM